MPGEAASAQLNLAKPIRKIAVKPECIFAACRPLHTCMQAAKDSRQQNESAAEQQQTAEMAQRQVTEHRQRQQGRRQQQAAEQQQHAPVSPQQQAQQHSLYEGRFGLPVVHRYLRYEELLRWVDASGYCMSPASTVGLQTSGKLGFQGL